MSIRVICLAVVFCVALEGASELSPAIAPPLCDNRILISIYAKRAEEHRAVYVGRWCMHDVRINGVDIRKGLLDVGKEVYDCPGPSEFLEEMMEEMRRSCQYDSRFVDYPYAEPLSEGIKRVGRGLTWVTTYYPEFMKFCEDGCFGHYERFTPLSISADDLSRPVITIKLPGLTITGLEQGQR